MIPQTQNYALAMGNERSQTLVKIANLNGIGLLSLLWLTTKIVTLTMKVARQV